MARAFRGKCTTIMAKPAEVSHAGGILGRMRRELPDRCGRLLRLQNGVIARWQAPLSGLTVRSIENLVRYGRWQRLGTGVYAAFTGRADRLAILWAAVLRAGQHAILSHETAAELDGLGKPSPLIHVTVPARQHPRPIPGVVVHRSRRIAVAAHPSLVPPQTILEETVLDLAQQSATFDDAFSWASRACQRDLTTPALLWIHMEMRKKMRWRTELSEALPDVGAGVHSSLEFRYVRDVERAHGLPRAKHQSPVVRKGRRQFRDVLYEECGVCVELDGREAHPAENRWHDIHRDNANAADGIITLRYGWLDITERPCEVAAQIARVLRSRGWMGRARPCGPRCPIAALDAARP
jgi:very-short-patch-repair endonuclease